jgi:hypothetical protein
MRRQGKKIGEGKIMSSPRQEPGRPELADFHQKVLMDDMMQVVGVDILDAVDVDGGRSYVRARANCRNCTCQLICRDWLAEHSQGAPQNFCPNAEFFLAVKGGDC